MKTKDAQKTIVIVIVAMVIAGAGMFFALGGGAQSIADRDQVPTTDGPWKNSIVHYDLLFSDKYTGGETNPTVKMYSEMPSDWNNPRGSFDQSADYSIYTSEDGKVRLNRHLPGTYYAVIQLDDYNTEFLTIEIPDGTGRGDLSDYQQYPDSRFLEQTQVGDLTDTLAIDFAITTNSSNTNLRHTELLTVAENTEFRGWKVIVSDLDDIRFDDTGDGIYNYGIKELKVQVGSKTVNLFEPNRGIDLFDSQGRYTIELDDIVRSQEDLTIRTDMTAITNTGNTSGDNNNGQLNPDDNDFLELRIFDAEGTVQSTLTVGVN